MLQRFLPSWIAKRVSSHKTLLNFSSSVMLYSIISMTVNIVILRWLDPAEMGLWRSLLVIQTYAPLLQFGLTQGLGRELSFALGKGDQERAYRLVGTVSTIVLFIGGLVFLGCIGTAAFLTERPADVRLSLVAMAFFSGTLLYKTFLLTTYRTSQSFDSLGKLYLLESVLNVLSLPLIAKWGYFGYLGKMVVVEMTMTVLNHKFRPIKAKSSLRRDDIRELLKVGIPIFTFGYIDSVLVTIPRMILLAIGGVTAVGLYSPAESLISVMLLIPSTLNQYIFPKMTYRLGKDGNAASLWGIAWKSTLLLFVIALGFAIVGWLLLPYAIHAFFPKYTESIPALMICLFSGLFLSINIGLSVMNSLKSWYWRTVIVTTKAVLSIGVPLILVNWYSPLIGVSLGVAIANMVIFGLGLYAIWHLTRKQPMLATANGARSDDDENMSEVQI